MTSRSTSDFNRNATMFTKDYSLVVGTTAVTAIPDGELQGKMLGYYRIWNVSAAATIWVSRSGKPAVVGAAGSFPLISGNFEVFVVPQNIPLNMVSIISDTAGTPVTIEVG